MKTWLVRGIAILAVALTFVSARDIAAGSWRPDSSVFPAVLAPTVDTGIWSNPLRNRFTGIDTLDGTHLWAVGSDGLIASSANGGSTWNTFVVPSSPSLSAVDFASSSRGWTVGERGAIFSTVNGGGTWLPQSSGVASDLTDVVFVDVSKGWAVGAESTILRTSDGGGIWRQAASVPLPGVTVNDVVFVNNVQGWVIGRKEDTLSLWASVDGGITWHSQTVSLPTGEWLTSISFVDAQHGWALASDGSVFGTSNGGVIWIKLSQVDPTNGGWQSIFTPKQIAFTSATEGWLLGNHRDNIYGGEEMLWHTNNGGLGWAQVTSIPCSSGYGSTYHLAILASGKMWAAGYGDLNNFYRGPAMPVGPQVCYSPDGGNQWNRQFGLDVYPASLGRIVVANDQKTAFAITSRWSAKHGVLGTSDGGRTWRWVHSESGNGIHTLDGITAWIVGDAGTGWRTTNAGVTWEPVDTQVNEQLNSVRFVSNNLGLIAGNNGMILRTTDGGSPGVLPQAV